MLKRTVTYPDLDGNSVSEEFYFNLNKAEILEMELETPGGLSKQLETLGETKDGALIFTLIKDIMARAIGKRSDDNRRFVKNQDIRDDFFASEAYSTMFMEMLNAPQQFIEFVNGLMPQDLIAQVAAQATDAPAIASTPDVATVPAYISENREPTTAELQSMTQAQLVEAFARKNAAAADGS